MDALYRCVDELLCTQSNTLVMTFVRGMMDDLSLEVLRSSLAVCTVFYLYIYIQSRSSLYAEYEAAQGPETQGGPFALKDVLI